MTFKMNLTFGVLFILFHIVFGADIDTQAIIKGTDAAPGEAPYMAAIIRYEEDVFCGGALISDRHILTAAHCASKYSPNNLTLIVGTNNLMEGGEYVRVEKIAVSDDSNREGTIGIAILTLTEKVAFSKYIKEVALPTSDVGDDTYAKFTGYGFQSTDPENGYMSEILQKLDVKIVNQEKCAKQLAQYEKVQPQHICAFAGTLRGPCYGDSGSPLVINNAVVGVALSVYPSCAAGNPDLYARTTSYLDFIKQVISS